MKNNIIEECQKYMLVDKILVNESHNIFKHQTIYKKPKLGIDNKVDKVSEVYNLDNLFWCFFIILNGDHEYELDHTFKKEKEFKIESIEKLRTIKSELKANKLRLNEIENELLNEKKISIKSFIALCLLYKKNILYIWNHKYFEIINNADDIINVIINNNGECKILNDLNSTKINYYKDNYWHIENINKQLKAITSYTRDELIIIVKKLEITDISSKKTKKEMYEKILEKI